MSLDDVLVVTVRKSFWASAEAEAFPHRVYAHVFFGHSTNLANSLVVFVRALVEIWVRRPRVVVLGSVERTVPWFIQARRRGLLRGAKLVITNQLHLSEEQLAQVDRVILYSSELIEAAPPSLSKRGVFLPLPADGDLDAARREAPATGVDVFSGGGAGRDFATLIAALEGTDVTLELVTFSRESLGWSGEMPANVDVRFRMSLPQFLARMAAARLVAVALSDAASPHGQTTVVQALALGKAIVATRSPGVSDYVRDGVEGLLVTAGDVLGYRDAIGRLVRDDSLREACEERARERARMLTYSCFRNGLIDLVAGLGARGRG